VPQLQLQLQLYLPAHTRTNAGEEMFAVNAANTVLEHGADL